MCGMNSVSFLGTLSCLNFSVDSKIISLDYSPILKWETGPSNQDLQNPVLWPLAGHLLQVIRGRDVWEKDQEFGKRICLGKVRLCVSRFARLVYFLLYPTLKRFFFLKAREGAWGARLQGSHHESRVLITHANKKVRRWEVDSVACGSWGQHYLGGDVLSLMVGQEFLSAGAQMKSTCGSSTSLELI